ncbi:hypothetical protein Bca4012_065724 [Brassica carinata]
MDQFKAETAGKEIARLKDELECSRRHERGSAETDILRAYRRGRRDVVKVVKYRREKFSHEFGELQGNYKALSEYRECRGTVDGLYLTQASNYLYDIEYSRKPDV